MKIFISWSGQLSQEIALLLRKYIPAIIHGVEPFVSSHDIESGEKWASKVSRELDETNYGIVCLSHLNHLSPWILFEAGALSKLQDSALCCLLVDGFLPADITSPLSQFQNRRFERDDFKKLLKDINSKNQNSVCNDSFDILFEALWPKIEAEYQNALIHFSDSEKNKDVTLADTKIKNEPPNKTEILTEKSDFQREVGIDKIYENEFYAADDIIKYSDKSDYVKCLSIRGKRFVSDDRNTNKLLSKERKYKEIWIMIADSNSDSCKERAKSFVNPITHHSQQEYQDDVEKVIAKIRRISEENHKIKLRLHCQPEVFRLIITYDYVFLSFYPVGVSASKSRVFRVDRYSELYKSLDCYFDWAWKESDL
jgi:hypothetical protein